MAEGLLESVKSLLESINAKLDSGELIGGYVNQEQSPLGRRKHCKAVRRRLAAGEDGAARIDRVHLLSRDALKEELRRESLSPTLTFPHPEDKEEADFHASLMKEVGAD